MLFHDREVVELLLEQCLDAALHRVTDLALARVPGCDSCSVWLVERFGRITSTVASDSLAEELERLQLASDEGPALDAARTGRPYRVDSISDDRMWPGFASRAADLGLVASHSLPLVAYDRVVGVLTMYSFAGPSAGSDEQAGEVLALLAGVAVANALAWNEGRSVLHDLRDALAWRDRVGQAKGIIMARDGCSADAALDVLRIISQNRNMKLRELARDIVESVERASRPDEPTTSTACREAAAGADLTALGLRSS
jgi:GAF domain-containing protein